MDPNLTTNSGFIKQSQPWLTLVILGGLFYIGGQYLASQPQRVQQEVEAGREITVQGTGEVTAKPDVARLSLGVTTGPQPTADAALDRLSGIFDKVVASVEANGVDTDDVKTTNLSVNPVYDFNEGRQTIRGFEATETIQVTIRNLDAIGQIASSATAEGVNQLGGVSLEIDDPTELELEAQALAIEDAKQRAQELARSLDAGLGRVKNFSASNSGSPQPFPYATGGELAVLEDRAANPPVPTGTNQITSNVTITYELR